MSKLSRISLTNEISCVKIKAIIGVNWEKNMESLKNDGFWYFLITLLANKTKIEPPTQGFSASVIPSRTKIFPPLSHLKGAEKSILNN